MKKIVCMLLTLILAFSLCACSGSNQPAAGGGQTAAAGGQTAADSDLAYIKEKGTLIVGITEFEPMDYQDASGNWIGFDADMAKAFAESLGVTAEFQIIDWDNKVFELNGKTIDCVWNGMTLTSEVLSSMECSNAYCNNAQVIVVPVSRADEFGIDMDFSLLQTLNYAVESGSAGQEEVEVLGAPFTEVADQATALLEVSAGTAEAAVIDALMAGAMIGPGTSYADLTYTVSLNSEEYGVGFRKDSDMAVALNQFLKDAYAGGTLQACAETYGIQAALVAQ